MNKKQLYESIMKDVSKAVKKHLNETLDTSWESMYKNYIKLWINNMCNNPQFTDILMNKVKTGRDLGYYLAYAMLNVVESGNLIMPQSLNDRNFFVNLIQMIVNELNLVINNDKTSKFVKLVNNGKSMYYIKREFYDYLSNEGCYFLFVNNTDEVQELADSGDYYYVCMLDENGEWQEVF